MPMPSEMSDSAIPAPRRSDWLLLSLGSTYKFTLVGFYLVALMTVLKHGGYSLKQLSWVQLIGGIEAFKVLFAALMDGCPTSPRGRFRPWLTGATLALAAAFAVMAFADVSPHFPLLLALCLVLSVSGTLYGCAMLGLSCIVLPKRELGFGGVVQTMAARGGKMIGGALVLWIYRQHGFQTACGFMLAFTLLLLALLCVYREPESRATGGGVAQLAARLLGFWQQPHTGLRWFALLFCATLPYAFCAAVFVPKLADAGYTPVQTGNILAVAIPVACLIVTPLAGRLARRAPQSLILPLFAVQLPLLCALAAAEYLRPNAWLTPALMVALSLSYTLLIPVLLALMMEKSDRQTAALDSSLQFSVILTGSYAAGFAALRLAQHWGYGSVFLAAVLLALPAGGMMYRMGKNKAV